MRIDEINVWFLMYYGVG